MSGLANANGFSVARTSTYTELQVASLNVASGVSIGSGTLTRNGVVSRMVVGYAPNPPTGATSTNSFRILAENAVLSLNTVPGLTNDTATSVANALPTTLIIPANSLVVASYINNNGTTQAGATTFDIGCEKNGLTNTNIFTEVPTARVNSGGGIVPCALGFAPTNTTAGFSFNATVPSFVTVKALGAPNTTGDLKVIIEYVQF